jgi:hypothetical protein
MKCIFFEDYGRGLELQMVGDVGQSHSALLVKKKLLVQRCPQMQSYKRPFGISVPTLWNVKLLGFLTLIYTQPFFY